MIHRLDLEKLPCIVKPSLQHPILNNCSHPPPLSTSADTFTAIYLQVKDVLLDFPLSPPGTRPIICIDECQVWIIKWTECTAQWRQKPLSGHGWRLRLVWVQRCLQQFHLEMAVCSIQPKVFPLWTTCVFIARQTSWSRHFGKPFKNIYHRRFLLSSASLSEESLCRVCGEKFSCKSFSLWLTVILPRYPWDLEEGGYFLLQRPTVRKCFSASQTCRHHWHKVY